jgi:hypothetical protein
MCAAEGAATERESRKGVNAPAAQDTQTPEQPPDVVLAAPYWSTADGFVSTIEMKNYHVSNPLTVTPVLHLENGGDVALDPIALKPSETRRININQALAKRGLYARVGAAEIRHAPAGAFGANLTVLNEPKSLIYNFQFRTPDMTTRLEGLWWFYEERTDGFVAAQNAGDDAITVTPTLYARERPYRLDPVKLRPHEMTVLRLREQLRKLGLEKEASGGISLESSLTGVLVAGGGLVNPDIGFSAPLRMTDPETLSMNVKRLGRTLHAIGVSIGSDLTVMSMGLPEGTLMNPIMNLRNITNQPIIVRPVFKYDIDGAPQSFALPEVRLNPQQVKRVDLLPYWESGQIFEQTSWGSLEINYTGRSGALIASVTSVDQTGTYVFDARIENRLAAGFHGEYWSIEGDNDTAVTVKNITDKPATCQLSLQYGEGRGNFVMQPMTLRPGEARMIMLREVQHERVTGTDGKSLPVEATFGGLKLTDAGGGRHFLIDTVVYNPKTATCGACGFGCVYPLGIHAIPSNVSVTVGGSASTIIQANMCDGSKDDSYGAIAEYTDDHPSTVSVTTGTTWDVTGAQAGIDHMTIWAIDVPGPHCGEQNLSTAFSAVVKPKVDILLNSTVITGTSRDVIVGQSISLSSQVQSGGLTATSKQWTVPGTRVANYVVVCSGPLQGDGTTQCQNTPSPGTSGTVTSLTNLATDNISYYWVDGGDGRQVQFSVTVNGVSNSATATFNVKRPTATVTATTGTVAVDSNYPNGFALHFGNPSGTPGVTFTPSITIPSGFTGTTEWIQMANSNRTFQPNVGSQVVFTASGLDTTYPYSFNNSTADSPGTAFSACDFTSATTNDSFTMWLMFKPNVSSGFTAIWVPLRAVSWSWTADASRNAGTCNWTLNSSSKSATDADSTAHPQWTSNANP